MLPEGSKCREIGLSSTFADTPEHPTQLLLLLLVRPIGSRTQLLMVVIGERMRRQNESAKKSDVIW